MDVRFYSIALIGTLAATSLATTAGAQAAETRYAKNAAGETVMVPLIAVSRVTSPDRDFIEQATGRAINTMNTSQAEIDRSRLGNIQGEAVRAFNTAAYAYNKLADIASDRRINVASPSSLFSDERTPNPITGTPLAPEDVQYLDARLESLENTIAFYAAEIRTGHDPLVVGFAKQMKARLEHDLVLTTIGIKALDTGEYGDRPMESDGTSTIR